MAKKIKINALDTLFFRDGRPFTMEDESVGSSVFPPAPSVFRGFVRNLFFAEMGGDISNAGKPKDPTLDTSITGYSLCYDENSASGNNTVPLYSSPLDLVILKDDTTNSAFIRLIKEENQIPASSYDGYRYILVNPCKKKVKESQGRFFLKINDLIKYLKGDVDELFPIDLSDKISDEIKIGIGRDDITRTTANTGQLYQIRMIRPENKNQEMIGFLIDYEGIKLQESQGILKLGGEGKLVTYDHVDSLNIPTIPMPLIKGNKIIMYVATPAIFKEGWAPKALFNEFSIQIQTAAIGRYHSFGGWDIVNRKPKPMFRAIPAGSVYYLYSDDVVKLNEFVDQFHGKALTHPISIPKGYNKEGFGIVYFGNQPNETIK